MSYNDKMVKKIKFVGPFFPSFFLSFPFFLLQTHSTTNGPFLSSSDPLNSQWFFFLLVFFFLSLFFFLSSSDPLHHVHRSNTQTQTHKHKPTTMAEDWFFYRVKWVGFAEQGVFRPVFGELLAGFGR